MYIPSKSVVLHNNKFLRFLHRVKTRLLFNIFFKPTVYVTKKEKKNLKVLQSKSKGF